MLCRGMMRSAQPQFVISTGAPLHQRQRDKLVSHSIVGVCHSPLVVWRVESSFNCSSSSLGSVGRACSTFCSVLRPSLSELCGGGGERCMCEE